MKVNHSGRVRVPTFWHLLSDAGRSVVSLNLPATYPPLEGPGRRRLGDGRAPPRRRALGRPEFAARLKAEVPGYSLRYFWKRAPQSLDELTENARLTAESFRGRAEGGLLADRMVPDWSALMVQFQNLDPFQHRAWRYLNVDETGIDRPRVERRRRRGHPRARRRDRPAAASWPTAGAPRSWSSATTGSAPAWAGSTSTGS